MAAGPFSFAGKHYTVASLDGHPKPAQRPRPPILIGGGRRRVLTLAGRTADIVGILTTSVATGTVVDDASERLADTVAQKLAWVREGAGSRFPDIELSLIPTLLLDEDRERAASDLIAAARLERRHAGRRARHAVGLHRLGGARSPIRWRSAAPATASPTTSSRTGSSIERRLWWRAWQPADRRRRSWRGGRALNRGVTDPQAFCELFIPRGNGIGGAWRNSWLTCRLANVASDSTKRSA